MSIEEKLIELQQWVDALANVTKDRIPQIRETLEGKTELPENCPSKESMAELILRGIKEKLGEVNAAYKRVEDSIFNN